jgi:hypothetical protein
MYVNTVPVYIYNVHTCKFFYSIKMYFRNLDWVGHENFFVRAMKFLSPSRRWEAPCEGTNSLRLFTPGETKALAKSKVHQ